MSPLQYVSMLQQLISEYVSMNLIVASFSWLCYFRFWCPQLSSCYITKKVMVNRCDIVKVNSTEVKLYFVAILHYIIVIIVSVSYRILLADFNDVGMFSDICIVKELKLKSTINGSPLLIKFDCPLFELTSLFVSYIIYCVSCVSSLCM